MSAQHVINMSRSTVLEVIALESQHDQGQRRFTAQQLTSGTNVLGSRSVMVGQTRFRVIS